MTPGPSAIAVLPPADFFIALTVLPWAVTSSGVPLRPLAIASFVAPAFVGSRTIR